MADLSGVQHAFWVVFGTLVGPALERTQHRPEHRPGAARDGRRVHRRRDPRDADRNQHDGSLGAAPDRDPARWPRARDGLVRRRPGGLHAGPVDPVQHPRAGRLEDRAGPNRGRRAWLRGQPRRRAAVLAARRRGGARQGALGGVRRQHRLPVERGRLRCRPLRRERAVADQTDRRVDPRRGGSAAARRHVPRLPGRAWRQAGRGWRR